MLPTYRAHPAKRSPASGFDLVVACCCRFFLFQKPRFWQKKSLGKGRMVEETVCRLILNCELLQNINMSNEPFQKFPWEIERLTPPKVVKRGISPVWLTPDRRELLGILARMMWNNSVRVHQRITTWPASGLNQRITWEPPQMNGTLSDKGTTSSAQQSSRRFAMVSCDKIGAHM